MSCKPSINNYRRGCTCSCVHCLKQFDPWPALTGRFSFWKPWDNVVVVPREKHCPMFQGNWRVCWQHPTRFLGLVSISLTKLHLEENKSPLHVWDNVVGITFLENQILTMTENLISPLFLGIPSACWFMIEIHQIF